MRSIPKGLTKDFAPVQAAAREWHREIVAYFDHPYTTGYVEGVNNWLSSVQRMGAGYSFDRVRAKALLAQGSHKLVPLKFRRMVYEVFGAGEDEPMLNLGVSIDWLQQTLTTFEAFEAIDPFASEGLDHLCQSARKYEQPILRGG